MAVNQLTASTLNLKAGSAANYSFGSMPFSGLGSTSDYDVYFGTATLTAGTRQIPLSILDIPSVPVAARCIVEAWWANVAAGAGNATSGAKCVGVVVYTAGAPDTVALTLNSLDATGALVATSTGNIAFRLYVPKV